MSALTDGNERIPSELSPAGMSVFYTGRDDSVHEQRFSVSVITADGQKAEAVITTTQTGGWLRAHSNTTLVEEFKVIKGWVALVTKDQESGFQTNFFGLAETFTLNSTNGEHVLHLGAGTIISSIETGATEEDMGIIEALAMDAIAAAMTDRVIEAARIRRLI